MSWSADTDDFSGIWSLAVEVSGTGVWDRNVATGEIRYSASWFRILGYEDAPQSNPIEVAYTRVHPEDLAYVQAAMQAHFDGTTSDYEVEHRLLCKDGSYKWVLTRGRVISRDDGGRALRMTGTTTDITNTRPHKAKRAGKRPSPAQPSPERATHHRRKPYSCDDSPAFPQIRSRTMPCFVRGTAILTPRGPIPVETLTEGDAVLTVRETGPSERRVIWAGQRSFGTVANTLPEELRPVLILANAFGPGVPERDLRLSPDHAIFTANHLVEAKHLINGITVLRDPLCRTVTYHHIELEAHDILLAENLPAESYLECGGRNSFTDFTSGAAPVLLRPDAAKTVEAHGCAPLAAPNSAALRKIRTFLKTQARRAGHGTIGSRKP